MNIGPDISSLSSSPLKKWPPSRRTVIVVVLVIIVVVIVTFLVVNSLSDTPVDIGSAILGQSKVEVKSEYKNPFDRNNQFVNPFSEVKSPFNSLQ
ncbi:MAG: hypothetical protein HYZ62_01295 [Candidatus Andersenbacteria bacterium]|nr:hypothetical protein [Candidatus Andersenbacteria bacterium]